MGSISNYYLFHKNGPEKIIDQLIIKYKELYVES